MIWYTFIHVYHYSYYIINWHLCYCLIPAYISASTLGLPDLDVPSPIVRKPGFSGFAPLKAAWLHQSPEESGRFIRKVIGISMV